MLLERLEKYTLVLASGSPRRRELMENTGFRFRTAPGPGVEESYPEALIGKEIAGYLAKKKSGAFKQPLEEWEILVTADTIVWQDSQVLHKPAHREEAAQILRQLSNAAHFVYTGVCLRSGDREKTFVSGTEVVFGPVSDEEIDYYITHYHPFDKAGAYGIQEWIGFIGVEEIRGSYFNVMGLPVHQLYRELESFIK